MSEVGEPATARETLRTALAVARRANRNAAARKATRLLQATMSDAVGR